tara:strand:+ start:3006 stop:3425 length:420 start_codon:yes stop_codon:yes gene_type:complete
MSINTNPERFYFVDNNRLALVEKNGTTTVDNASTSYKTISEAKPIRINTIAKASHFNTGANITTSDITSPTAGPLAHIPTQFHEALVYRVIAMGYKSPPKMDLPAAQFFDAEYAGVVKEAKKFARSNYIHTGVIAPQDF